MYISISGNLATGKSSLLEVLASRYQVSTLSEDATGNPFLQDFIREPQTAAIQNFLWFLDRRTMDTKLAASYSGSMAVMERSINEDINVFGRAYQMMGFVSSDEFAVLSRLCGHLLETVPQPAGYICLESDLDEIERRIRVRGNFNESEMSQRYLMELDKHYREWHRSMAGNSIIINTTSMALDAVAEAAWGFVQQYFKG